MQMSGIDVSHYQDRIEWTKVHKVGINFAFIKASEGNTLVDKMFTCNWTAAGNLDVLRGAYHFFRPELDPLEQAKHFLKVLGKDPGELPPALDIEVLGNLSPDEVIRRATHWMTYVESKLHCKPILYTGSAFWRYSVRDSTALRTHPLWIAHYTTAPGPRLPTAWPKWTFWQFSQQGRVAGIKGDVDMNAFNGTAGDLYAMCFQGNGAKKAVH